MMIKIVSDFQQVDDLLADTPVSSIKPPQYDLNITESGIA